MFRRSLENELKKAFKQYPVVTLIGPWQSGKSTLVRHCFNQLPYVNLEDPETRRFVVQDPKAFLNEYPGGAIFDEIQNTPELLSYIQVEVDKQAKNSIYILQGAINYLYMRQFHSH